jgi:hypothetical protein
MIENLATQLIDSLKNGNWLLASLVLILIGIFKLPSLIDFFEQQGRKRIIQIEGLLTNSHIDEPTRDALKDELNRIAFRKATGISGSKILREEVVKMIENSNGELQPLQIARAQQYISVESGRLKITLGTSDRIWSIFNLGIAVYLGLTGLVLLVTMMTQSGLGFLKFITYVLSSITFFAFSILIGTEASRYSAGKLIKQKLVRYSSTTTIDSSRNEDSPSGDSAIGVSS